MQLLSPKDAGVLSCPFKNDKCSSYECMAWQFEELGVAGGIADKGYCGLIPNINFKPIKQACSAVI